MYLTVKDNKNTLKQGKHVGGIKIEEKHNRGPNAYKILICYNKYILL